MITRRKVRLTREGWYYAIVMGFIIGGAVLREVNLLFVLSALMMGPLFFSWRFARQVLGRLSVQRRAPARAHAGESSPVSLTVFNPRRFSSSWAVVALDHWQLDRSAGERRETAFFPHVAPRASATAQYVWKPPSRGRFRFDRIRLTTRFPFGFLQAWFDSTQETEVLVAPRLGRMLPAWRDWIERAARGEEAASQRRGVRAGDYYGLREWRPGDSRRWIHWRSSARQGHLTTLQFEEPRQLDIFLLVDLWAPAKPGSQELERVETALSMAATAITEFGRHSRCSLRLGLAGATSHAWSAPVSAGSRGGMLDIMAEIGPSPAPDWRAATPSLPLGQSWGRVVVISTRPQPVDVRSLQEATAGRGAVYDSMTPHWIEIDSARAQGMFESPVATSAKEGIA